MADPSPAVLAALAPIGRYAAALMRSNPGAQASWLLARPDLNAVVTEALTEGRDAAAAQAEQAWDESGGVHEDVIERLLADIDRNFSAHSGVFAAVRRAHPGGPESVQGALGTLVRQVALKAAMSASYAAGAGATSLALDSAQGREAAGEALAKRWRSRKSPATCHWCRKLDGVTIGLGEDFYPHLGGPVAFPHQAGRSVATPAGERAFGLPIGTPIIYTHPPKPYLGHLPGPLLHPHCECRLEIVPAGSRTNGSPPESLPVQSLAPEGFLSSEEVRNMPEEKYRSLIAFLGASVHELEQLLRRLARRA